MLNRIKDPGSAITHFIGMLLAICAGIPLLRRAINNDGKLYAAALAVFAVSAVLLYAASSTYHTYIGSERVNKALKRLDHMMIYVLIAGTYTPVCLIVLGGRTGWMLLCLIWGLALLGILFKAFWVDCPKWVS
ncbi:MAG: hemolysin III family protein, partial [Firmicutes bacterium]|nr:hemolysin III family protein [Bacillota bacterium]